MAADGGLGKQVQEDLAALRAEYERETKTLTEAQRKAAAPWFYGDYKYFRPQLDGENQRLIFTPTPKLRRLQLQQALTLGGVRADNGMEAAFYYRVAPFTPPQTTEQAVAMFETLGATDPARLLTKTTRREGGLEGSSSDLAMIVPEGAFLKAGQYALTRFFLKAAGEVAAKTAISVAAEKVAEKYGPAAGVVVPFVPTIVGLMTRRVVSPALRKTLGRFRGNVPRRFSGSIENLSSVDPKGFLKNVAKRTDVDPNGFLDVVLHANQEFCEIAGRAETPEYLARIVAQDPKCTGKVRLIACLTGNSDVPGGGPSFAQRFANALKEEMTSLGKTGEVEVQGTNGLWITTDKGAHGPFPAKKVNGKWVEDPNPNAEPAKLISFKPQ